MEELRIKKQLNIRKNCTLRCFENLRKSINKIKEVDEVNKI